jgi:excisionase family DNA binding protein
MKQASRVGREVPAVVYDVRETAAALRLSVAQVYELIRSGQLRTIKIGKRRLVPVASLQELIDRLAQDDVA